VSEEYTAIAREAWDEAGVADRIELRLGPALESLGDLEGPFDLAFIDADKGGYAAYLDAVVPLLRRGGALLVDNTLWHGDVVRAPEDGSQTGVIQDFNDRLAADDRLESVILPISDGLTLARKR
jgi:caffeoyl-CoA O-methyltransferase